MELFFIISAGILGIIIGSFLNVVILRMNTGMGIGGRSMCFSCGKQLRWYELIPVVSYLIQGGRCRGCSAKISAQYAIVELATGLLFAGVVARFLHEPFQLVVWLLLVIFGVVISGYDARHKMIPIYPMIGFGLAALALFIFHLLGVMGVISATSLVTTLPLRDLLMSHLGGLVLVPLPFFLMWLVSRGAWIGFGDIEIMAVMGFLLGMVSGYSAVFVGFWSACLFLIPWVLYHRVFKKRFDKQIPMGPFLLLGIYLVGVGGLDVLKMIAGMVY